MTGFKVFISVDMEGVACVTHGDHVTMGQGEYELARKWMTAEANAAIKGAFEMGAAEVVVADAHANMRNLLPDELHEDALLVRGSYRPLTMMQGLDETFAAALLIGYHARAGDSHGVLAHTYVLRAYNLRLNGLAVGEAVFNAAIAGHFGVPVALVSGDDALAAEVREQLPWAEQVVTKWAIHLLAAQNLTPKAAQKCIREATKRALGRLDDMKPLTLETPIRLEVDFKQPVQAHLAAEVPGVERLDARTVAFSGADMLEIVRIWRLMMSVSPVDFT